MFLLKSSILDVRQSPKYTSDESTNSLAMILQKFFITSQINYCLNLTFLPIVFNDIHFTVTARTIYYSCSCIFVQISSLKNWWLQQPFQSHIHLAWRFFLSIHLVEKITNFFLNNKIFNNFSPWACLWKS